MDEVYSISEASKILDISNELLRHYERMGIIAPERADNGYRYFSTTDIEKLIGVRKYRNLGFPLEEIEELLYSTPLEQTNARMQKRMEEIKKEIIWQNHLLEALQEIYDEYQNLHETDGVISSVQLPRMLRIVIREKNNFWIPSAKETTGLWINYIPVVSISPGLTNDSNPEDVHITFGLVVSYSMAEELGLSNTKDAIQLPEGTYLTTVIHSRGKEKIHKGLFEPIFKEAKRLGKQITGDAWGITIGTSVEQGETLRYHRIYLPIA